MRIFNPTICLETAFDLIELAGGGTHIADARVTGPWRGSPYWLWGGGGSFQGSPGGRWGWAEALAKAGRGDVTKEQERHLKESRVYTARMPEGTFETLTLAECNDGSSREKTEKMQAARVNDSISELLQNPQIQNVNSFTILKSCMFPHSPLLPKVRVNFTVNWSCPWFS